MGCSVEVDRIATEGRNFMPDPFVSDHDDPLICRLRLVGFSTEIDLPDLPVPNCESG
ncbi:MAG: hypothetical protein ACXWH0_03080 [Acidimicrobiia bacterium]